MKRLTKKGTQRTPSPESPDSKYKDGRRSKESGYKPREVSTSAGRGAGSLMDNDWNKKYDKDDKRRGSRGGSPRPRDDERERSRDKRKKEKRSTLSEEEEEILNSLIAMRREEKSRQKKSTRREPERRERASERRGDERRERRNDSSRRDRDRGSEKRKRKRKLSKDSSDDSSDDSSSSSSQSSDGEIDVGNTTQKQQEQPPVSDSALDRIAKIISDSTNGQVQFLNQIKCLQLLIKSRCLTPAYSYPT